MSDLPYETTSNQKANSPLQIQVNGLYLPFDHSMISLLLSVSIFVSWYRNSGTVLVVGIAGTTTPADTPVDGVIWRLLGLARSDTDEGTLSDDAFVSVGLASYAPSLLTSLGRGARTTLVTGSGAEATISVRISAPSFPDVSCGEALVSIDDVDEIVAGLIANSVSL